MAFLLIVRPSDKIFPAVAIDIIESKDEDVSCSIAVDRSVFVKSNTFLGNLFLMKNTASKMS